MTRLFGNAVIAWHLRGQTRAPFLDGTRIAAARDANIRRIVSYAARTVPQYREMFAAERIEPRDIRTAADLDRLPVLNRALVRQQPLRFLSESRRARGALVLRTSGTTGTALEVAHDAQSALANIAWGERERKVIIALAGAGFRPKELYLGFDSSNFRRIQDFYTERTRMPVKPNRRMVPMSLPFDEIVAAINAARPDVLTAYAGFIDMFISQVVDRGVVLHRPRVVMAMGETMPHGGRERIERAFGCTVLSRYSAVEAFKIGYVCEAQAGYHVHDDLCHVRILTPDRREARTGEIGEIVISNLVNHGTVLLNYPMGDLGSWAEGACPCGRRQRRLAEVLGRVEDMLLQAQGRRLHPRVVWQALKDDARIAQYQLIQHELDRFDLKLVVPDRAAHAAVAGQAVASLRRHLGLEARISVTFHESLGAEERARTGKFRAVESRVPARVSGAV